jgi:hypothetical protein
VTRNPGATNVGSNGTTKDEAARNLARKHYEIEEGITHIFRLMNQAEAEVQDVEPIKLLEVHEGTVSSGVMPLHFGPAPASGIAYPSIIVEVTSTEFERIKREELTLPRGWTIGEEIPRPADLNGN